MDYGPYTTLYVGTSPYIRFIMLILKPGSRSTHQNFDDDVQSVAFS